MHDIPVENLALLIPIITVIAVAVVFGCFLLFKHLRRSRLLRAYHEESMAALSKGIPMAPWPEALLRESDPRMSHPARTLLKGLIWAFIGIALFFSVRQFDRQAAAFALIPIGIGLAYLIFYWVEGRKVEVPAPENIDKVPPVADAAKI